MMMRIVRNFTNKLNIHINNKEQNNMKIKNNYIVNKEKEKNKIINKLLNKT